MLVRDEYAAFRRPNYQSSDEDHELWSKAFDLVWKAVKKKKIVPEHDDIESKWRSSKRKYEFSGSAIRHELYDISPTHNRVLICVRHVEGSKYGQKTTLKEYFLIKKVGSGVQVIEVNKAVVAKAAKAKPEELGYVINVAVGKEKLQQKHSAKRVGYKFVAKNDADQLVSVWDGSVWEIGKTRTERATDDHSGGFYYYKDIATAEQRVQRSDVFGPCRSHNNLVLIEVEVSGKEFSYGNGKYCATHMKPIRIIKAYSHEYADDE